jgi:hypothetical protein
MRGAALIKADRSARQVRRSGAGETQRCPFKILVAAVAPPRASSPRLRLRNHRLISLREVPESRSDRRPNTRASRKERATRATESRKCSSRYAGPYGGASGAPDARDASDRATSSRRRTHACGDRRTSASFTPLASPPGAAPLVGGGGELSQRPDGAGGRATSASGNRREIEPKRRVDEGGYEYETQSRSARSTRIAPLESQRCRIKIPTL